MEKSMHKILSNQAVRIIMVQIAVAADANMSSVADEMSSHLSENGVCEKDSHILDWAYVGDPDGVVVVASDNPEEGEIFLKVAKAVGGEDLFPDQNLAADGLKARYDNLNPSPHAWSEHPVWTRKDWQLEVREGNTSHSYWEWVESSIEMHMSEYAEISTEVLAVAVSPSGFIVEKMETMEDYNSKGACRLCGEEFAPGEVSWLAPGSLYPICEKCSPVIGDTN